MRGGAHPHCSRVCLQRFQIAAPAQTALRRSPWDRRNILFSKGIYYPIVNITLRVTITVKGGARW